MARRVRALNRRPSPATVIAFIALVVALGGFAIAAVPGRDGVIRACYNKKTGALRVLNKGTKCKRGESKLSWSQKGRAGKAGVPGQPGQPGERGQPGEPGQPGPAGANAALLAHNFQDSQVSTTSNANTDLGGPSVTVDVPAGALVSVFANVDQQSVVAGTIAKTLLIEPTDYPSGTQLMQSTSAAFFTYFTVPGNTDGSSLSGGWRTFQATPGTRTYSLQYKSGTAGQEVRFKNRRLWVAVFK